jgi:hypothetical protein
MVESRVAILIPKMRNTMNIYLSIIIFFNSALKQFRAKREEQAKNGPNANDTGMKIKMESEDVDGHEQPINGKN